MSIPEGGTILKQFDVTGMSCAACSARVEKAVSHVPGVTACAVSLLTNSMGVEGTAPDQAIIDAVQAAGYGASVQGGQTPSAPDGDALAAHFGGLEVGQYHHLAAHQLRFAVVGHQTGDGLQRPLAPHVDLDDVEFVGPGVTHHLQYLAHLHLDPLEFGKLDRLAHSLFLFWFNGLRVANGHPI